MASIVTEGTDIDGLRPGWKAGFRWTSSPSESLLFRRQVLEKIKGLMALIAFIVLTVTTLCVMTTLIAVVSERTREIGLMKAIGADDRGIVLQFLTETLVIGLAGVLAGLATGFVLAQILGKAVFGSAISFRLAVLPMTLRPSVCACLLAAALPVRMAVRIVPAQVLKE
jgi:putative ABC transport system permease protein